jgi:hypothetical protein
MKTHLNNSMCNRVSYICENFEGLMETVGKNHYFQCSRLCVSLKISFSTPMELLDLVI